MAMLADLIELVIGVDTHKHTPTAAVVVAATGAVIEQLTVPATQLATSRCCSWRVTGQACGGGRLRAPVATALG
jgi:hypothetical protein